MAYLLVKIYLELNLRIQSNSKFDLRAKFQTLLDIGILKTEIMDEQCTPVFRLNRMQKIERLPRAWHIYFWTWNAYSIKHILEPKTDITEEVCDSDIYANLPEECWQKSSL